MTRLILVAGLSMSFVAGLLAVPDATGLVGGTSAAVTLASR